MRLAKEVRAFKSFQSFPFGIELVGTVCRQNEGWLKSTQKLKEGARIAVPPFYSVPGECAE